MQHLIDYIRQNAATYPREMIDAQLRQVGHSEADIHHAWGSAFAAPMAGSTAAVAVMGGGPVASPIVVAGEGTPWYQSTYMRIVMVIVFVVAGYGAYTAFTDGPKAIDTKDLSKRIAERTGTDQETADEVMKSFGGSVDGKLPSGWKVLQKGMWVDYDNGNSVNMITMPLGGVALDEVVKGAADALSSQRGITKVSGPKQVEFQGRDVLRLKATQSTKGQTMQSTQLYVAHGGDVSIITVTISPSGEDQADEAVSVADDIKIPA